MEGLKDADLERTRRHADDLRSNRSAWSIYADYVQEQRPLYARSRIEWRLAGRLLDDEPPGLDVPEPPAELLMRCSGAMVAWVVGQRQHRAGTPPGRLAAYPPLSSGRAVLFARGWAAWPQNPALPPRYDGLAAWLQRTPAALGWVVTALVDAGAVNRASACAAAWVRGPLGDPPPGLVATLLGHPALRPSGLQIMRRLLILRRDRPDTVEALGRVAFDAECYRDALAATEHLAAMTTPGPGSHAIGVAALARLGAGDEALDRYRRRWYGTDERFPYPHDILPLVDRAAGTHPPADPGALRRHLLAHHTAPEDASPWVQMWLRAEAMDARGQWEASLPLWFTLFIEPGDDARRARRGYFLIRLTDAFLDATPEIRAALQERFDLDVETVWGRLRGPNPTLAGAALVLLAPGHHRCIERFHDHLADRPAAPHRLMRRAVRAYLDALLHLRYWDELGAFLDRRAAGKPASLCTPDEVRFLQSMIDADAAAEHPAPDLEVWCRYWETLLGLPLPDDRLIAVVDHFALLLATLRRRGLAGHAHVEDVGLQITRRGKAVGERILTHAGLGAADAETWRRRLRTTTLGGLAALLRDMTLRLGAGR